MTIHIPRWLLIALGAIVALGAIGVGAYELGRSAEDDGSGESTVASSEEEPPMPPPDCSEAAARRAVIGSVFESFVRELGAVAPTEPLFKRFGYVVGELVCRDFTGDGVEEMVVQLACCTGGSPSPWAIFAAEAGKWQLVFHRENIQAALLVEGDQIVEKVPAYAAGDPTCCPSTFRFGRVAWSGHEFVYESDEADRDRVIKAGTQGVTRLGDFHPQTGSPLEAADAFGPPSYVGPNDELCINDWRDLGLVINFANLGGADPCSTEGRVGSIELRGVLAEQAGWETDQGVHVGMKLADLRHIYPDAETQSFPGLRNVVVLIEGPTLIGEGGTYPVLSARVTAERISELRLSVGAAGE